MERGPGGARGSSGAVRGAFFSKPPLSATRTVPRLRPAGTRYRFRTRLFSILLLFAVCPSVLLTLLWVGTVTRALPLMSGGGAWERAAATGERALTLARSRVAD